MLVRSARATGLLGHSRVAYLGLSPWLEDGAPRAGVRVRDWVEDEVLGWLGRVGVGVQVFAAEGEALVEVEGGDQGRYMLGPMGFD